MPHFNPCHSPYSSHRNPVFATRAMACTSVPAGAQIGIHIMKQGGNAIDAAVAMAAAMPVLEPTGNGLGSDAFALVWIEKEKKLYGLNASGISPKNITAQAVRDQGFSEVPRAGWLPTMVAGAPAGWAELASKFGTKPLTDLFAPAIDYARNGMAVPVTVAPQWAADSARIKTAMDQNATPHQHWWKAFMKSDGTPYQAGDLFQWEDCAKTLEELAETNCESYYRGDLMRKIVDFSRETGGFFEESDFENYRPEWVEPITCDYKGYTVCEIPPNGHGLTALMALNILGGLPLSENRECGDTYHKMMESIKLAFADTMKYVADPKFMTQSVERMLSEEYTAHRRSLITEKALYPEAGDPSCGGTIYLCTADQEGNMVSYIQSNYTIFGAGIVIPGTGISLQNRGANFSMNPDSDNYIAGGKKSYHTIIPGFMLKDGDAVGPFGVMGAFMQPQGHLQMVVNTVDYHLNPQASLDAPRVQWVGGLNLQLEREVQSHIGADLASRGHQIEILNHNRTMGRGQIIWKTDNGLYIGGTESRCDGTIASW